MTDKKLRSISHLTGVTAILKNNKSLVVFIAVFMIFTGCSDSSFVSNSSTVSETEISETTELEELDASVLQQQPEPTPQISRSPLERIKTACNSGSVTKTMHTLYFEDRVGCEWRKNGNLAPKDGYTTVRHEQAQQIKLPEHAILCQFDIKSSKTQEKFIYDDALFFTLNDLILISSGDAYTKNSSIDHTVDEHGIYSWNFDSIKGLHLNDSVYGDKYCFGDTNSGSICALPSTQKLGEFSYKLDKESSFILSSKLKNQANLDFKVITIGDNDARSDCSHSGLSIDVDVEYVLSP